MLQAVAVVAVEKQREDLQNVEERIKNRCSLKRNKMAEVGQDNRIIITFRREIEEAISTIESNYSTLQNVLPTLSFKVAPVRVQTRNTKKNRFHEENRETFRKVVKLMATFKGSINAIELLKKKYNKKQLPQRQKQEIEMTCKPYLQEYESKFDEFMKQNILPFFEANKAVICALYQKKSIKTYLQTQKDTFEKVIDDIVDILYDQEDDTDDSKDVPHVHTVDDKIFYLFNIKFNKSSTPQSIITYNDFCNTYKETGSNHGVIYDRYAAPNANKTKKFRQKNKELLTQTRKLQDKLDKLEEKQQTVTPSIKGNLFQKYNHYEFTQADIEKVKELKKAENETSIRAKIKEIIEAQSSEEIDMDLVDSDPTLLLKLLTNTFAQSKKQFYISKDVYDFFKNLNPYDNYMIANDEKSSEYKKYRDKLFAKLASLEKQIGEDFPKITLKAFDANPKELFEQILDAIVKHTSIDNDVYLYLKFKPFQIINGSTLVLNEELEDGQVKQFAFVPVEEKEELIKQFDDQYRGLGIEKLYLLICDSYLGITQKDVRNVLTKPKLTGKEETYIDDIDAVQTYQLTKGGISNINSPIIATSPNFKWSIDLIDLNYYNLKYDFLLTCIDVFSKKCWIERLRRKSSLLMQRAFVKIIHRAGVFPYYVVSDNGGEFQKHMKMWCKNIDEDNNPTHIYVELTGERIVEKPVIKVVNTLSYTPKSNGLIENLNKMVRVLIRKMIVDNNNNSDWIHYLHKIEDAKNSMKNSVTKFTPNQIWTSAPYKDLSNNVIKEPNEHLRKIQKQAELRLRTRAKQILGSDHIFHQGDIVRVKMTSLFSKIRQKIKSGDKKHINLQYSPFLFMVLKTIKSKTEESNTQYQLVNLFSKQKLGKEVFNNSTKKLKEETLTGLNKFRRLFGDELQLVIPAEKVTVTFFEKLQDYYANPETRKKIEKLLKLDRKILKDDVNGVLEETDLLDEVLLDTGIVDEGLLDEVFNNTPIV